MKKAKSVCFYEYDSTEQSLLGRIVAPTKATVVISGVGGRENMKSDSGEVQATISALR